MIIRLIHIAIFALPVLVGVHAVIAITEIGVGFGGWQAAMVVNTTLAAAVFAITLLKSGNA